MRRSPKLDRMLSKDPKAGEWTLSLPLYNPDAMKIILDVIHSNHQEVPSSLDYEKLRKVLVIGSRLGLLQSFLIYGEKWYNSCLQPALTTAILKKNISSMWMASALGLDVQFQTAAANVSSHFHTTSLGRLILLTLLTSKRSMLLENTLLGASSP